MNDSVLVRYLLGGLDEEDRRRVEERLLTEPRLLEQLEMAEDELADHYVGERLSPEDRERFERHFLSTVERHRKVDVSEALQDLASHSAIRQQPQVRGFRRSLPERWSRVSMASLLAAAALVLAVLGGLLLLQSQRLGQSLRSAESALSDSQRHSHALRRQLHEERRRADRLAQDLDRERASSTIPRQPLVDARKQQTSRSQTAVQEKGLSAFAIAFVLEPGLLRDVERRGRTLELPRAVKWVRLRLDLEGDEHRAYRAVLLTLDGQELWTEDLGRRQGPASESVAILNLPAALFENRDYLLSLRGKTSDGGFEDVYKYSFRVKRVPSS